MDIKNTADDMLFGGRELGTAPEFKDTVNYVQTLSCNSCDKADVCEYREKLGIDYCKLYKLASNVGCVTTTNAEETTVLVNGVEYIKGRVVDEYMQEELSNARIIRKYEDYNG